MDVLIKLTEWRWGLMRKSSVILIVISILIFIGVNLCWVNSALGQSNSIIRSSFVDMPVNVRLAVQRLYSSRSNPGKVLGDPRGF